MSNPEEVRETQNQLIKINQEMKELTNIFLDGKAYDLSRINVEIKSYLQHAAWAKLEIGKRFVVIKEMEGHGNWLNWLKSNYDFIEPRVAQQWMNAAIKIARHNLNTKNVSHLPLRKIYLLMQASDDELEELAKTGSIRGMKLDDIDRLSHTELKEKFRKTLDQVDEGKKQLEKVEQENERLRGSKIDEIPEDLKVKELESDMISLIGAMSKLYDKAKARPKEERMEAGKFLKTFSLWSSRITGIINPTGLEWEPVEDDYYERKQDEEIKAEQNK